MDLSLVVCRSVNSSQSDSRPLIGSETTCTVQYLYIIYNTVVYFICWIDCSRTPVVSSRARYRTVTETWNYSS